MPAMAWASKPGLLLWAEMLTLQAIPTGQLFLGLPGTTATMAGSQPEPESIVHDSSRQFARPRCPDQGP